MNLSKHLIKFLLLLLLFSLTAIVKAEDYVSGVKDLWDPPGRMITVGTHRLHIFCQGAKNNKPTVIIDSGLGGFSLEWRKIQNDLSGNYHICSYDRAGYGWSDPGPFPRTTRTIVAELKTLLNGADVSPPYLLIGHSFGGYNMMYYAKTFPDEVKGLVLIDSSHPDQANWFPSVYPDLPHGRRRTRMVSTPKIPANYPIRYRETAYHLMNTRKARNAMRFESMNFEISGRQVSDSGTIPEIPLVILTRGERAWPRTQEGEKLETTWVRLQNELARMSGKSKHVIADFSGHFIHLDQPILVEDAIREIVEKVPCDGEPQNDNANIKYAEFKQRARMTGFGEC